MKKIVTIFFKKKLEPLRRIVVKNFLKIMSIVWLKFFKVKMKRGNKKRKPDFLRITFLISYS
jgi:hypothetical protein